MTKFDVAALARLISAHAPYDGTFDLRIPGVHAVRVSRPNTEMTHAIQRAAVCIVAQGAKTVSRHVGYLSASQFSREYGRLFGAGCANRHLQRQMCPHEQQH